LEKLLLQGRLYLSGRLFFPGELCLSGRPYFSGGLALLGKLLLSMLFFVWIAAAAFPGMSCMAAEEDSTIDFVLVLDNSGTMAKSDPEGLTVSAAKMFIDMLPHKNARVAVVEFGSDYGADAYDAEKYSSYVSVPFPLSDISTVGQKIACKKVIAQTTQDGEYTPVGYAFQAACDVLEKGGAKPEDAGILLISDFRVTGQKHEDFLDGGYSYKSLEDAEQTARKNKWPVYTLEMNIDGRNDNPTDYRERIAARLRSGIPEAVGAGDYLPLHNASQAQTLFADIFKQFFDPNNRDDASAQSQTTDDNGDAAFPFSVGEMVAELNVTLTCENSAAIRSIEIGYGGQMAAYDLTAYQEPIQEEDRVITKEDRYVTVKLMLPPPSDDWKVIVHGDARTQLGMYALSIHDMDFTLGVSSAGAPEASDSLTAAPMDTVHLAASFIYDGQRYQAEKVYTEYGAVLEIVGTGQQIPMTAGNSEYFIDLAFDVPGTYTLKAIVNGDTFRTGSIESGICTVTIEGSAAQNVETEAATEPETETEAALETERSTPSASDVIDPAQIQSILDSESTASSAEVYIYDLKHDSEAALNDCTQPMYASALITVPILYTAASRIDAGQMTLDDPIPYVTSIGGRGEMTTEQRDGLEFPLSFYLQTMVNYSDNNCINVLIDYIGLDQINAVCQEAGYTSVNLERGLVAGDPGGLDNYVSAKDITMMVKDLYTGAFTSIGTDFMKTYFHISEGDSLPTLAGLAPGLQDASYVLNQNGHGMTRYNETAVIEDNGALYILTIMLYGDSGMVYSPAVTDVAEYVSTAMAG
jgi:hypothetical protein